MLSYLSWPGPESCKIQDKSINRNVIQTKPGQEVHASYCYIIIMMMDK